MEFQPTNLFNRLKELFPNINIAFIMSFTTQLLQGVAHLHSRDICHLDLKLDNILLQQGPELKFKLIDFEYAGKLGEIDEQTIRHNWKDRTLLYMPPEVIRMVKKINKNKSIECWRKIDWKKVDVFSLGVTLFTVIFYTSPFASDKASSKDEHYKYIKENRLEEFWSIND